MKRALAGALASIGLLALAGTARAPWSLAALVAFAPWLWAVERARPRQVIASALLLSAGFVATCFGWFPGTLAGYTGLPAWSAWILALLLSPLVLQPQLVVAALLRLAGRRLGLSRPAFVCGYLAAEWLLPKLFGDTLGLALHPYATLRQLAELAGPPALTLLCLVVSECVALAALRPALLAAGLTLASALFGAVRVAQVEAATRAAPAFTAGVVQAAIGSYDKLAAERGAYQTVRQILDDHRALSAALGAVDLLVWPETMYPTTFGAPKSEEGAAFDAEIAAFSQRTAPLVFGAFAPGQGGLEHNAAFFLRPGDGPASAASYQKALLFPLTEWVPPWLDSPRLRELLPWAGHWQPGPGPRAVPVRLRDGTQVVAAPLICYEALAQGYLAAEARAGADFILTLSNDAWFPDERAPRLHLVSAAFRSVEARLPQVRATNSGISALVLPSGEVVSATGFGERAAIRLTVPRMPRSATLAKSWGDWLAPTLMAILAVLAVARLRSKPAPG